MPRGKESHSVHLILPEDVYREVEERAGRESLNLPDYLRRLIAADIGRPVMVQHGGDRKGKKKESSSNS